MTEAMLNISSNTVSKKINRANLKAFQQVDNAGIFVSLSRFMFVLMALLLLFMFVPWTQNIQGDGIVTTLKPEHRPQTIHSVISGRIETWYVEEGQFIQKGDTLLKIVEIQDAFFDPEIVGRTDRQVEARRGSLSAYGDRILALRDQIDAMKATLKIRTEQVNNRIEQAWLQVQSDSIQVKAAEAEIAVARLQAERAENLLQDGLKSLTDVEGRQIRVQEATARLISAQNRLLSSRNELLNARAEAIALKNEFADRIALGEATLQSARTNQFDTEADIQRLETQLANITIRTGYRYITAPQDGYIAQAIVTGIGENIKEGEPLLSIMPANYELAAAFYVRPIDLPLIKVGTPVRFWFDGWPAFVFSGWPQISFGTFGGRIVAIDNFTDTNNKYRVLVAPDHNDEPWPVALRVGSGAKAFALLGDVPVWYEIWRQLNGFPPDYYAQIEETRYGTSDKVPIRKIVK
jgi:adhesin transport system membrane fusion protein